MKYYEKNFACKLKQFCLDNGFEIAGTCSWEGIYGEITICKIGDDPMWQGWDDNKFNFDGNGALEKR